MGASILAYFCLLYLIIYNSILMFAGIIITFRGVYYYTYATDDIVHYYLGKALVLEQYYRLMSSTYIVPGCIMIFVSAFGLFGAIKPKLLCLLFYCVLTTSLMVVNAYGLYTRNDNYFSLHSYLNRVFVSEDFTLLNGIVYPEVLIQMLLVLSACYLVFYITKREDQANDERSAPPAYQADNSDDVHFIYSDTAKLIV